MSAQAVQLIVSLLTIVMSGVASAVVTHKLNARRQERDFLRQKLEQLFLSVRKYGVDLGCHFLNYDNVMVGKLTYDQANDLQIQKGADDARAFDNATMLISIYFPELQDAFDKIIACRERGADILGDFKRGYLRGQTKSPQHHNQVTALIDELDKAEHELFARIRTIATRINGGGGNV